MDITAQRERRRMRKRGILLHILDGTGWHQATEPKLPKAARLIGGSEDALETLYQGPGES